MPRRYSTREVAGALGRIGISFVRQRGSHMRFSGVWRGQTRNVSVVARQKEIPAGTMSVILEQAGLTAEELDRLVEGEDLQ